MQFWSNLLFILQILSAMAMIGLVLIQHGKGADMGASFGSGASGSLFGATGSANFLSRSTAICATVFFATTIGMSVLQTGRGSAHAAWTPPRRPSSPARRWGVLRPPSWRRHRQRRACKASRRVDATFASFFCSGSR
jgi:preprotein translocase subunit SecG